MDQRLKRKKNMKYYYIWAHYGQVKTSPTSSFKDLIGMKHPTYVWNGLSTPISLPTPQ